jgi:hypothetical protein
MHVLICFLESPLANTYRLRPPVADSGSVDSLKVASSLVTNCIDNHEECLKADVPLPSRVLDVGSSGNTFKLIDDENLTGRYATLSYCVSAQCTSATLNQ